MNKIAVYTTMMGDHYSIPGDIGNLGSECDFLCFTDKSYDSHDLVRSRCHGWKTRTSKFMPDSRFNSKFVKVLSCAVLPEYDYSIWVDSTHTPILPPQDYIDHYLDGDIPIAVFRHPSLHTLKEEAHACVEFGTGNANLIIRQAEAYEELGIKMPLIAGNVVIRRRCPNVAAFEVDWFSQILQYSSRDQLGFGYAEHQHKDQLLVNRIAANVYDNEMFQVGGHASGARALARAIKGCEPDLAGSTSEC